MKPILPNEEAWANTNSSMAHQFDSEEDRARIDEYRKSDTRYNSNYDEEEYEKRTLLELTNTFRDQLNNMGK